MTPASHKWKWFRALHRARTRMGLDSFVLLLVGAILLARYWPGPGVSDGPVPLREIADFGVSLIFFFYGLKLSPQELRSGLANWRLHLVIQGAVFVLFPLLILAPMRWLGHLGNPLFWMGTFYLAALPSTVSSSVVMVSIARGNMPAAIFNASISSLLGVFITPLWMGLYLATSEGGYDLGHIFLKLSLQVLLPVVLGLALHHRLGNWALRHRDALKWFDQGVILLIVYTSFCASFAGDMFADQSAGTIVGLGVAMAVIYFAVYGLITLLGRWLRFSVEDHIAAVFCGSKKSLVHGTVMSKVLFSHLAGVGVVLLPLMLYHTLQLIFASVMATRFAKRSS
ncbi:MAG: bile acid:sodium symporter [Proteobacteria bacterium]|nr:bile acid:sodium symporter [Pseudomonadota bacterium]